MNKKSANSVMKKPIRPKCQMFFAFDFSFCTFKESLYEPSHLFASKKPLFCCIIP